MKSFLVAALVATSLAGVAQAGETPKPEETSIPFMNHRGIDSWRADGSKAIYIRDRHGDWYHATFMGPCTDLPFAETVGFEARGPDTFDRFGTVLAGDQRCALQSFVKSDGPPSKGENRKSTSVKPQEAGPASGY